MNKVVVCPVRPFERKKLRRLKRQRTNAVNCRHARIQVPVDRRRSDPPPCGDNGVRRIELHEHPAPSEFDIEIPRGELFPEATFRVDPEWLLDGKLTDKGLAELRSRLPYADLSGCQGDRNLTAVPDLFTVGLVAAYVKWKLDRGAGADSDHLGVKR